MLAHVSEAQQISPEEISLPKIIRTTKKQIASLSVFGPAEKTADLILKKTPTPARIAKMLGKLWDDDWIKARKKTRATKPPLEKKSSAHTSVYREIQAYQLRKDV